MDCGSGASGADPNVLGRTIVLNEHDFMVIGVAPKDFAAPFAGLALDVWTPVMMIGYVARPHFSLTDRGSRWLMAWADLSPARRAPGASEYRRIAQSLGTGISANTRTDGRCGFSVAAVAVQLETEHATSACDFNGCSCRCTADCLRQCCATAVGTRCLTEQEIACVWP